MFTYVILSVLGLLGFALCLTIIKSKHSAKPLVCPLEGSCETVIHSKYSTLFGIPLEIIGLIYYAIVAICYGVFAFLPYGPSPIGALALVIISFCALLFSLVLTGIQAMIIRHWCTWCLFSAGISIIISLLSILTIEGSAFSKLIDIL